MDTENGNGTQATVGAAATPSLNTAPRPKKTRSDAGKPRGPKPPTLPTTAVSAEAIDKAVEKLDEIQLMALALNGRLFMEAVLKESERRMAKVQKIQAAVKGEG